MLMTVNYSQFKYVKKKQIKFTFEIGKLRVIVGYVSSPYFKYPNNPTVKYIIEIL